MRYVRGRAEAISILRYQLYELLINMSQSENACRFMDEGNLYVQQEAGAGESGAICMTEIMKCGSFCPCITKKSLSHKNFAL